MFSNSITIFTVGKTLNVQSEIYSLMPCPEGQADLRKEQQMNVLLKMVSLTHMVGWPLRAPGLFPVGRPSCQNQAGNKWFQVKKKVLTPNNTYYNTAINTRQASESRQQGTEVDGKNTVQTFVVNRIFHSSSFSFPFN